MPSLRGMRHLSGLSHRRDLPFRVGAPLGFVPCGDLCGLYRALSQCSKLVVEDIPLVVWGLCFGKVGVVISCLVGPVRGYRWVGPVSPDPYCLSLQYLCCRSLRVGGLGSGCYIWSTSSVLSGVLCEFKYALSNSLFLSRRA